MLCLTAKLLAAQSPLDNTWKCCRILSLDVDNYNNITVLPFAKLHDHDTMQLIQRERLIYTQVEHGRDDRLPVFVFESFTFLCDVRVCTSFGIKVKKFSI